MFNNIIYIIIVLVVFNFNYPGEGLLKSPLTTMLALFLLWLNFSIYCRYRFAKLSGAFGGSSPSLAQTQMSSAYQLLVTRLSILSIVMFALCVYLLNLKYWLLQIPGFGTFSVLPGAAAIAIYFAFLSTIWHYGYPVHYAFSHSPERRRSYIGSNIKLNLPILFPWASLTICYDAITLVSWPSLKKVFESQMGQFAFFAFFLVLLVIFLPPFVKYFWGCSPLPDTEKKRSIVGFLRAAGFKYRDLLRWPILEGRMLTAGVMGLVPRLRYILVTDSLVHILTEEELHAVMAHEVAHVRYRHMLFYVLFLLGYMALTFGLFDVFFYAMLALPWSFGLLGSQQEFQTGIFYLLLSLPFILSIILYFRYIMGFFMRNFERQADLYSVRIMGRPDPIVMSLEKISQVSGQSRHQPSWHHFSIAERVEFLWRSWQKPELVKRHTRRLGLALTVFFVLILSLGYALNFGSIKVSLEHRALERILNRQLAGSSEKVRIYRALAALYHQTENLARAKWAYENIIILSPDDGMALNNLAWILATAEDRALRDYPQALSLAEQAVGITRSPTFLDTLAEAYFVNGYYEDAVVTIQEALDTASDNKRYLKRQLERFEKAMGLHGTESNLLYHHSMMDPLLLSSIRSRLSNSRIQVPRPQA